MWEGKLLQWAFAEEAHEIGMQLAKEILGSKYEFVLSYHEIRRASDQLSREHGLSVIVPGRDKGKSIRLHRTISATGQSCHRLADPMSSSMEELLARL